MIYDCEKKNLKCITKRNCINRNNLISEIYGWLYDQNEYFYGWKFEK